MAIASVVAWAVVSNAPSAGNTTVLTGVDSSGVDFISLGAGHNGTITGVTDSKGNTWQIAGAPSTNGDKDEIWYCTPTSVGAGHSITITFSATGVFNSCMARGFSGLAQSSVLDQVAGNTGTGTAIDTGNVTTLQADELLISSGQSQSTHGSTTAFTAGTSFLPTPNPDQFGESSTNATCYLEYRIVSSTGSYSGSATAAQSGGWSTRLATFKGFVSGGAQPMLARLQRSQFGPYLLSRRETRSYGAPLFTPSRIQGSSTLSVSPAAVLRGTGRLAGTSSLLVSPSGTARGTGRLLGSVALVLTPAGTLHGAGANSIAGSIALILTGTADLNAFGRLVGANSLTLTPAGVLHASGRLSGAAALQLGLTGDLNALGRLLGSSTLTLTPTGTARGSGRLAGSAAVALTLNGALQGLGSSALRGTIALAITPSATIRATGRLGGTLSLTLTPAANLRGLARVQGGVFLSISAAGDLNAFGRLAGSTGLTLTPTARTDAAGGVRGTATLTLSPSGALRGMGRLAGIAQLAIALLGILRDQGAQSVPNSVQSLLALLVNSDQTIED